MRQEEKDFMLDCMRISPFDLIWYDKVQKFIDEGVISCVEDVKDVTDDGGTFLPHRCDARCLVYVNGKLTCRKTNNLKKSPDNTKHVFKDLPNDLSQMCKDILVGIGLMEPIEVNDDSYDDGYEIHSFFCRHAL